MEMKNVTLYSDKSTISTLSKECLLEKERKKGNTTRQADFAIQKLFKGNIVKVEDHSKCHAGDRYLFDVIMKRLNREHYTNSNKIICLYDYLNRLIKLEFYE